MLANPSENPELRDEVAPELYPDEKLLWVGKPTPIRVLIRAIRLEYILNAVVFTVLAVGFWGALAYGGVRFIWLGGVQIATLTLFLIPVVVVLVRGIYSYWRAGQIVYAVTNRRVLIIRRTIDGKDILAYNLIPFIERRIRANGKGDLIFATETYSPLIYNNFGSRNYFYRIRKVGFWGIENALAVERLIVNTFHPKNTDT